MFKYISDILSKFTQKQRIVALILVLLSIIVLTLGPTMIDSLTYDDTELKAITKTQKTQISQLNSEVFKLQDDLIKSKSECTNLVIQREKEILIMIEDLQRGMSNRNNLLNKRMEEPRTGGSGYEVISGDTIMVARSQAPIQIEDNTIPEMMEGLNRIKSKIKKDIKDNNE